MHNLRTPIRSSHPIIVIEPAEEEWVLTLLQPVAAQERMPRFKMFGNPVRLLFIVTMVALVTLIG